MHSVKRVTQQDFVASTAIIVVGPCYVALCHQRFSLLICQQFFTPVDCGFPTKLSLMHSVIDCVNPFNTAACSWETAETAGWRQRASSCELGTASVSIYSCAARRSPPLNPVLKCGSLASASLIHNLKASVVLLVDWRVQWTAYIVVSVLCKVAPCLLSPFWPKPMRFQPYSIYHSSSRSGCANILTFYSKVVTVHRQERC